MTPIALVCPRDHESLLPDGNRLRCAQGHAYPVIDGVPVLLIDDIEQTAWWVRRTIERAANWNETPESATGDEIHPHVQRAVSATNGILYKRLVGKLTRYPIPELRLPNGVGRTLVDIGCNWGRWTIAAARKGYQVIGIDPQIDAIMAARQVARQCGVEAQFIVGDARFLPFADASVDTTFSYSVLQHFSKENARTSIAEAGRILRTKGTAFVQMPNWLGLRCLYHQARRGFAEGQDFDVRYWSIAELRRAFEVIGPTSFEIDGFFGLGVQPSDVDILPLPYRAVVRASEWLRGKSKHHRWMVNVADSVYALATRS